MTCTLQQLVLNLSPHSLLTPLCSVKDDVPVTQVTSDSRHVTPGSVFVALEGEHTDGHSYLSQAVDKGAVTLLVLEKRVAGLTLPQGVAVYSTADTWAAYGWLASALAGHPGQALTLVGVTGTNGKTTVTHLIEAMLRHAQQPVAMIGTLGTRITLPPSNANDELGYTTTGHTTPMAAELQATLAEMKHQGAQTVVMEVSSHALAQSRVAGCAFQVAVHTNITQDHLDFHGTMQRYAEAKALLFSQLDPTRNPVAVINVDDAWGTTMLAAVPQGVHTITYGLKSANAALKATDIEYAIHETRFTLQYEGQSTPVTMKLAGEFGVYNALAALAAGLGLGLPLTTCVEALSQMNGVRGRFEVVAKATETTPAVVVDYAHTPDGLDNILQAVKRILPVDGKLIAVFGCGGDRDATKRPKMGAIANQLADKAVVTSDNPRSEDPQQIITDILHGIHPFDATRVRVQPDREQAIHAAIDMAGPNDVVVVAGKGHEDYQILADRTIHFDDREVVQAYLGRTAALV